MSPTDFCPPDAPNDARHGHAGGGRKRDMLNRHLAGGGKTAASRAHGARGSHGPVSFTEVILPQRADDDRIAVRIHRIRRGEHQPNEHHRVTGDKPRPESTPPNRPTAGAGRRLRRGFVDWHNRSLYRLQERDHASEIIVLLAFGIVWSLTTIATGQAISYAFVMDADRGEVRKVSHLDERWIGSLAWSPDGKRLAFCSDRTPYFACSTSPHTSRKKMSHAGRYHGAAHRHA